MFFACLQVKGEKIGEVSPTSRRRRGGEKPGHVRSRLLPFSEFRSGRFLAAGLCDCDRERTPPLVRVMLPDTFFSPSLNARGPHPPFSPVAIRIQFRVKIASGLPLAFFLL